MATVESEAAGAEDLEATGLGAAGFGLVVLHPAAHFGAAAVTFLLAVPL